MLIAAVCLLGGGPSTSIDAYLVREFKDAKVTARVKMGNQKELAKINSDFGLSYRFKYSNIQIKEPWKFRAESEIEDSKLVVTQNGMRQKFDTPIYRGTQELSTKPGRLRTMLEFGILTPSLFNDFFNAKFIRLDRATNDVVFDLTYVDWRKDNTRYRIWIDPEKRFITKREWYGQTGEFRATFYYENPKLINGVWAPTTSSVKNADGAMAGSLNYENLKINVGVPDSVFRID